MEVTDLLPEDIAQSHRKSITAISYSDANLCDNTIINKSIIGLLNLLNKIPTNWYSEK